LRAAAGLPSLRLEPLFVAARDALADASRDGFRVLHFSVQADHLHLPVEGDDPRQFVRGIQGLAIRTAKAVNRVLCRAGRLWNGRYHVRALRTPREVRNAFVYVLDNFRKHLRESRGLDSRSSASWFDGWRGAALPCRVRSPVAAPHTWLARVGWRRYGSIDVDEAPRLPRRAVVGPRHNPKDPL
jgi:hypothetical protein